MMPGYRPITAIAASLLTDEQTLLDFRHKGWIQMVERNGTVFVSADQRYRAKYILYLLHKKHLSDYQIQLVLSIQRPPYSAAEVDQIVKRHGGSVSPGEAGD